MSNELIIHDVEQGSKDWHGLREKFTKSASVAAVMMGVSPYAKRTEMLDGFKKDPTSFLQRIYDKGHEVEALARDILEDDLVDALYQQVATRDNFLASLDGITLSDNRLIFECKQWNESLAEIVKSGKIPDSHKWQLVQQQYVFDCDKTIFVVTDGTKENWEQVEFTATQQDVDDLLAGWAQFDKDMEAHVPKVKLASLEIDKRVSKELTEIEFSFAGELVVTSNIEIAKKDILEKIKKDSCLICGIDTHGYFADAIKDYAKVEEKLKKARENAIKSNLSVAEFIEVVDFCYNSSRNERLAKSKELRAFKANFDITEINNCTLELQEYISKTPVNYEKIGENFKKSIKGMSNLDNKLDALDSELARCKIIVDKLAENHAKNSEFAEKYAKGLDYNGLDFTLAIDDFNPKINFIISQEADRLEAIKDAERDKKIAVIQAFALDIMPTLHDDGLKKWLAYYENYDYEIEDFGAKAPQALTAVNAAINAIKAQLEENRKFIENQRKSNAEKKEIKAIVDECLNSNRPDLFESSIQKLGEFNTEFAQESLTLLTQRKDALLTEIEESHAAPAGQQPIETSDEYMAKKSGTFNHSDDYSIELQLKKSEVEVILDALYQANNGNKSELYSKLQGYL